MSAKRLSRLQKALLAGMADSDRPISIHGLLTGLGLTWAWGNASCCGCWRRGGLG